MALRFETTHGREPSGFGCWWYAVGDDDKFHVSGSRSLTVDETPLVATEAATNGLEATG